MDDAVHFFELNNDPDVLKYTGDVPFTSLKETKAFIANYPDYEKHGFGRWAVQDKETNEVVGWCGLRKNENTLVDIGYRFKKKHWNKGYATEAAEACLAYGFHQLGLTEIIGNANESNKASIRVFEKIGMHFQDRLGNDDLGKCVRYIIKKEWLK